MIKVLFKLYEGKPVNNDEKGYYAYITEYVSLKGAQRVLRTAFGVDAMYKETPTSKLVDFNVVRSYLVPNFEKDVTARFYIIKDDTGNFYILEEDLHV